MIHLGPTKPLIEAQALILVEMLWAGVCLMAVWTLDALADLVCLFVGGLREGLR